MDISDILTMYQKDPYLYLSQNKESIEEGMQLARNIYQRAEQREIEELEQMIQRNKPQELGK